jgi:hypothetical protein
LLKFAYVAGGGLIEMGINARAHECFNLDAVAADGANEIGHHGNSGGNADFFIGSLRVSEGAVEEQDDGSEREEQFERVKHKLVAPTILVTPKCVKFVGETRHLEPLVTFVERGCLEALAFASHYFFSSRK